MKALFITLLLLLVAVVSCHSYRTNLTLQRGLHRTVAEHVTGATVSLNGGITRLGEYYTTIYVGPHLQPFNVQIDTGSSMLAIPVDSCSNCVSASYPPYNSSIDRWHDSPCGFPNCRHTIRYADGTGVDYTLVRNMVKIGNFLFDADIGFIEREIGRFGNYEVPGIMGVASRSLNPYHIGTVLDEIHYRYGENNDTEYSDVFGLCLTPYGGAWDVGYINESRANRSIVYHSANAYPGFYALGVSHVVVEFSLVSSRSTFETRGIPAIIDSGTTLLVLPYYILTGILAEIYHRRLPGYRDLRHGGDCTRFSDIDDLDHYPDLQLMSSDGIILTIDPDTYFIPYENYMCLGLSGTSENVIIVGDVVLQSLYTVFDHRNNRVGFAPVNPENCPGGTFEEIESELYARRRRLADEQMAEAWRLLVSPMLTLEPFLIYLPVFVLIIGALFELTRYLLCSTKAN